MKHTLHFVIRPDLYEVVIEGTLVYSVERFSEGSSKGYKMSLKNLPDQIKKEIVKKIVKEQKGK